MDYATIQDIVTIARPLAPTEQDKAQALLDMACAKLRVQAKKYGKNLDSMIEQDPDLLLVAKEIVIKAVVRALDSSADTAAGTAISGGSQSALGYSATFTYLNAGQSLYFLRNELKELGILRQTFGALEVFGNDSDD